MKPFNQKQVTERFAKLPEVIQEIITSEDTNAVIREAMETVGLEGEKKRECIQQITLVAVGFASADDFHEYVHTELQLDHEQATTLETSITNNIFTPIKTLLLQTLQNNSDNTGKDRATNGTIKTSAEDVDPYREV